MSVVARPALACEQARIEGLMQFYIYDWSEMEKPESDAFTFNLEGRFDAYPGLGAYWEEPEHWPFLIEVDGRTAGFALLNTHSHLTGGRIERNMAEFFIARKHRRRGVALEAVRQVLRQHPGQWEVAVAERNIAAKLFWPKALSSVAGVSDLYLAQGHGEQGPGERGEGEHWRGPIWRFHCRG
jgi:predicted acetyltransferase